ncbi:hypothetical protein MHYP_G00255680 [Metynnis hypsauchen]
MKEPVNNVLLQLQTPVLRAPIGFFPRDKECVGNLCNGEPSPVRLPMVVEAVAYRSTACRKPLGFSNCLTNGR